MEKKVYATEVTREQAAKLVNVILHQFIVVLEEEPRVGLIGGDRSECGRVIGLFDDSGRGATTVVVNNYMMKSPHTWNEIFGEVIKKEDFTEIKAEDHRVDLMKAVAEGEYKLLFDNIQREKDTLGPTIWKFSKSERKEIYKGICSRLHLDPIDFESRTKDLTSKVSQIVEGDGFKMWEIEMVSEDVVHNIAGTIRTVLQKLADRKIRHLLEKWEGKLTEEGNAYNEVRKYLQKR